MLDLEPYKWGDDYLLSDACDTYWIIFLNVLAKKCYQRQGP